MGLFANFVSGVMAKRIDGFAARAERAGARGVDVARGLAPIRTGRLRESINFYWDRSTLTLVLSATAPYASMVNRRRHFMEPARAAMMGVLSGGTVAIQFDSLDEKYHDKAKAATRGQGIIIGHRKRVKFKR